ncbi:MAG: hypothetical protein OER21_02750 [Gemmatimonadota bacterium]|nr:hypothetical protein [Gemmatimonadota bacterium]
MGPETFVFLIPLAGIGISALFLVGVYKLATRWLDRRGVGTSVPPEELERVHQQLAQLEDLPHRMLELEERLDFAERLLAQQRRDALPGGT